MRLLSAILIGIILMGAVLAANEQALVGAKVVETPHESNQPRLLYSSAPKPDSHSNQVHTTNSNPSVNCPSNSFELIPKYEKILNKKGLSAQKKRNFEERLAYLKKCSKYHDDHHQSSYNKQKSDYQHDHSQHQDRYTQHQYYSQHQDSHQGPNNERLGSKVSRKANQY